MQDLHSRSGSNGELRAPADALLNALELLDFCLGSDFTVAVGVKALREKVLFGMRRT